ncbi:MAG: heparan-alpha-glucosaminide N-acetyltransferase domain-containing protein [Flavobacterium sp.]|nr:heparan-alpha-glucosaminide N-acetyltransferase domain-containing protein [Flavobacterium sp.]
MNQRYYSLDVFRGATVALMILVNNPGNWEHIFAPLDHAVWHGCTPTDLVFPFFLFAVGNAMAFVMPKFQKEGTAYFLKKVLKRTILIFLIGLLLNWSPFIMYKNGQLVAKTWTWINSNNGISGIRIMGVLQRIALCYCLAACIVFFCKNVWSKVIAVVILLGYWLLCLGLGSKTDPYSLSGFFGTAVDINLFGAPHVYKGEGVPFDPEGLASTFAAIVEVMIGYYVGSYIQKKGKCYEMLTNLFVAGATLILVGYWWDMVFPINKKIWTSSYTLYTSGLAIITISILIFCIEFKNASGKWSKFFDVFGKNPLFIFVLSGFLPRVLGLIRWVDSINLDGTKVYTTPFTWFYNGICKYIVAADLRYGSLLYALCMIAFYWLIVYILDKKKIYVKV